VVVTFIDFIGRTGMGYCQDVGRFGVFALEALKTFLLTRLKLKKLLEQVNFIGITSLSIVLLIGAAVGGVLALQSYVGLHRFGQERFIGPLVFISMVREFGPVLTAVMVTGRAGSAMTAELGTMRITEQIDALQTLCLNLHQYLIVPRVLAATIILPFLSIFCTLAGIFTGYIVSISFLRINPETYLDAIRETVILSDITTGLFKAIIFGFLLAMVSCYKGFTTRGGAKGVGISTTQSVVYSNVLIFVADYVLTSLLLDPTK